MICNNIGKRLKECRENLNYTQKQVSEKMHVQRQIISYHESGERQPGIDDIVFYAKLYNVSADYLLGLSDAATTDITVQEICKKTGLSEDLIVFLQGDNEPNTAEYNKVKRKLYLGWNRHYLHLKEKDYARDFLNALFENEQFPKLCSSFFCALKRINSAILNDNLINIAEEDVFGCVWPKSFSENDLIKYNIYELEQTFLKAIHKMTKFDEFQNKLNPIVTEINESIHFIDHPGKPKPPKETTANPTECSKQIDPYQQIAFSQYRETLIFLIMKLLDGDTNIKQMDYYPYPLDTNLETLIEDLRYWEKDIHFDEQQKELMHIIADLLKGEDNGNSN